MILVICSSPESIDAKHLEFIKRVVDDPNITIEDIVSIDPREKSSTYKFLFANNPETNSFVEANEGKFGAIFLIGCMLGREVSSFSER